jgi:hypothetical protein
LNTLSIFSIVARELMELPRASLSAHWIGTALPWLAGVFNG